MTTPPAATGTRPPYAWAAVTFAVILAVYVLTLAPTTAFWDASEYIAAAKVLGIPHPPGNPLFVLLAHVFGLLPLASSYAARINLFAATTSAAAAGLWFLVAERWMRNVVTVRWARLAAAFGGVLVSATMWTIWNQSTVNEKVYTVSLLSMALVMWLAVHWGDDQPGPHRDRWVILIAYILALSSTNHMMGVLAAPAVAVYILWTDWRVLTRPWVILGVVGALLLGVSVNYLFLPIRAAQSPPINEGEPVGFFSQALMDVLGRVQYGKPSVFQRQADFISQLGMYWQYFSWQFARDFSTPFSQGMDWVSRLATAIFTALGLGGLVALWQRDRRAGAAAAAMLFTLTLLLIFYLNFKYGFSQHPGQPDLPREVRERDYFFMGSFAFYGLLVAAGLGALMQGIVNALKDRGTERTRWLMASPVLLFALIPLAGNHVTASRANEYVARDYARDLLESVEPYGILITAGDNDTFPLWFAQEVEGIRPDVTVANLSLMNTRWHLRQLRRRNVPDFDPSKAAPVWRTPPVEPSPQLGSTQWSSAFSLARPAGPLLSLTEAQLDSLPEVARVPKNSGLRVGGIQIAFQDEILMLQDLATIALIRDNLGKRPIFFSWSDGGYPDQTLGLSPYLVSQGLVRKLLPVPADTGTNVVLTRGMGFLDLERTRALLWDVYNWKSVARNRPRGWVDAPSGSILTLYSIVYRGYAEAVRLKAGDAGAAEAARADSVAAAVDASLMQHPQVK